MLSILSSLPITSSQIVQYVNIFVVIIMILCALLGFVRGMRKSIYYLIATAIVFIGGWILMNSISSILFNFNLSSYGIIIPIDGVNYELTTVQSTVSNIVSDYLFGGVDASDTLTLSIILGVADMAVKIVYYIIWIILAFTVFKIIFDVLWIFFKPKKKRDKKGKLHRPKPSFTSRLIGCAIGAGKGLLYTLLILFIFGGITSIAETVKNTKDAASDLEEEYAVVIVDDTLTLISLSEEYKEVDNTDTEDQIDEILDLVLSYKETIPGKVFGSIKVKDTSIDEALFDGIFSINGKLKTVDKDGNEIEQKYSIKLRKELEKVANALSKCPELISGEFDLNTLKTIDTEVLESIIDDLTSLEIVKVIIPVGLEVVLMGDLVKKNIDDPSIIDLLNSLDLDELKSIDYSLDFENIGYVFIDVVDIIKDGALSIGEDGKTEFDFFALPTDVVNDIFERIGSLGVLNYFAPIAISYLVDSDMIKDALNNVGLKVEDLKLDTISAWKDEISNIGYIYEAFVGLGLSQDDIEKLDFSKVKIDAIDKLTDAIFNSVIISNAIPLVTNILTENMGEYNKYISLTGDIDWKNELNPLLKAVVVLLKTNILSSEDILKDLAEISNDTITELSDYLSQSSIIKNALSGIMGMIVDNMSTEGFTPEQLSADEWTKSEISNVLLTVKEIATSGILENGTDGIKNLSDSRIDSMASHISSSKFFTRNLSALMDVLLNSIDMGNIKIKGFENAEDWTKSEIVALLKSAKIIILYTDDLTKLISLKEEELDTLLGSSLITDVLVSFIEEYTKEGSDLDIIKGVDLVGEDDWNDKVIENVNFELINSKLYIDTISSIDVDKYYIYVLNSEGIYEKVASTDDTTFDFASIISNGASLKKDGAYYELKAIPGKGQIKVSAREFGEIRNLFNAIGVICKDADFNTDQIIENLTKLTDPDIRKLESSIILSETVICEIETLASSDNPSIFIPSELLTSDEKVDRNKWSNNDETFNILSSLATVLNGGEINSSDLKIKEIVDNKDKILKSLVLCETLKKQILKIDAIDIPSNEGLELDSLDGWKNTYNTDGSIKSVGEISTLLESISIVLNITDDTTLTSFDTSNISINNLIDRKDEILRSVIITNTIKTKLTSINGIVIPSNEGLSEDDLGGWKNEYSSNGNIAKHGELSVLLNTIKVIFNIDDSTTIEGIDANSIKLKKLIDSRDEVLMSLIMSATIKDYLSKSSTALSIPSELNGDSLDGWKNVYNSEEVVTERGELSYLLYAIELVLNPSDDTSIDNFNVDINISTIVSNKDGILHSKVLSSTIKDRILEAVNNNSVIALPNGYDVSTSKNYIVWENEYEDSFSNITKQISYSVTSYGELDALLSAIGDLLGDLNCSFDDISSFNYGAIFDPNSQEDIVSSKIISETIITKIEEISALSIPASDYVNLKDHSDRSDWWDIKNGEIINFLNAIGSLLTDEQKQSLTGIDLSVDLVYSHLTDESSREVFLRSYIASDTVVVNFLKLDSVFKIPKVSDIGIDLSSTGPRDNWYKMTVEGNFMTVEHKELWNMLSSIKTLLGSSYTSSTNFTIDQLLANPEFIPILDENENNTNDVFDRFFESKMMEEIFKEIIANILVDGTLKSYINSPNGGYLWYNYQFMNSVISDKEYDLKTVCESLYYANSGGLGYNITSYEFGGFDTEIISNAFVLSRTYKGSIELMFNTIFQTAYQAAYYASYGSIETWDEVKFIQSDFDSLSKVQASALIKTKLDKIINNINSVI